MPTPGYTDLARQLAQLKAKIRASAAYLKTDHKYALTTLARVTGLHKNSIMKLDREDWDPSGDTLQKLELLNVRADAKRKGQAFDDENARRGRPLTGRPGAATSPLPAATPSPPPARATRSPAAKPAIPAKAKERVGRRVGTSKPPQGQSARAN